MLQECELGGRRPLGQQIFESPKHRLGGTGAVVISSLGLRPQIRQLAEALLCWVI